MPARRSGVSRPYPKECPVPDASACVAVLSQELLDAGSNKATLYADATNPTSNKIYEAVGYRYVGDAVMVAFVDGA